MRPSEEAESSIFGEEEVALAGEGRK